MPVGPPVQTFPDLPEQAYAGSAVRTSEPFWRVTPPAEERTEPQISAPPPTSTAPSEYMSPMILAPFWMVRAVWEKIAYRKAGTGSYVTCISRVNFGAVFVG